MYSGHSYATGRCSHTRTADEGGNKKTPNMRPGHAGNNYNDNDLDIGGYRAKPNRESCPRSSRKCHGHGLRLSWPRPNDRRRAVVSNSAPSPPALSQISHARFVHTSHWDIELYRSLSGSFPVRNLPLLDVPISWKPTMLESLDRDLLEYFCGVASASLAAFGHDTTALGSILVRIAQQDESAAAAAVLQALLAFSSLHRYGLQSQAVELKIAALGNLSKGSEEPILCAKAAIQHIATGMLLCSFELYQPSCALGEWMFYLVGVKTILNTSSMKKILQLDSDIVVLLDWVHYYDVLARFSLLHWKGEGAPEFPLTPTSLFSSWTSNLPPPIYSMLNLLSQVCDTVYINTIPIGTSDDVDDYKGFLKVLDWKIRSIPIPKYPEDNGYAADDATLVMQLYQLAILLFLNRGLEGLIDQPIRTQQHIDQAFAIFAQLSFCKQQFPIHVIGCEARTDEQRAVVLDVISRTENANSSRPFNDLKRILQAVWAQHDLADGDNIGYLDRLTSVMNHCRIVPSFV